MWVMAGLVWRKLFTVPAIVILLACLAGLGVVAFDSDVGVITPADKALDWGYMIVRILVYLAVIFLGGTQLALEVSDRTAMFWLARPLFRWQFVVGKFLGASVMGWILLLVFGLGLAAMFVIRGFPLPMIYFECLAADVFRVVILAAIMTCLSTGMGYMPAAMIGGFLSLVGIGTFVLPFYCRLMGLNPASWILWLIYLMLPNWYHFDFGLEIGGSPVYWLSLAVYTAALAWLYLAVGIIFFQKRDLG